MEIPNSAPEIGYLEYVCVECEWRLREPIMPGTNPTEHAVRLGAYCHQCGAGALLEKVAFPSPVNFPDIRRKMVEDGTLENFKEQGRIADAQCRERWRQATQKLRDGNPGRTTDPFANFISQIAMAAAEETDRQMMSLLSKPAPKGMEEKAWSELGIDFDGSEA